MRKEEEESFAFSDRLDQREKRLGGKKRDAPMRSGEGSGELGNWGENRALHCPVLEGESAETSAGEGCRGLCPTL